MNLVVLSGNLTKDPVIKRVARKDTGEILVVGRYGFAIDRELSKQIKEENPDMQKADFVSVAVFGGKAEFAEKYLKKGSRIILKGKLRSGDYINKYNQRVFITEILADKQEFAESKKEEQSLIDEAEILDNMNIFSEEDYSIECDDDQEVLR